MNEQELRFAIIQHELSLPLPDRYRYQARRRALAHKIGCGYYELELMEGITPEAVAAYIGDTSMPRDKQKRIDLRRKRPERYKRYRAGLSIKDL